MSNKLHLPSVINIGARVLGMLSGMFGIYVFSRLFTVDDFGIWSWLLSISVIVTSQDFGLLSAMRVWLGKEYAQNNQDKQQTIFLAGITSVIAILMVLVIGEGIYWLADNRSLPNKTFLVFWVLFTTTFSILGTVCANALLAFLNSGVVGAIELIRSILQILAICLIYLLNLDLSSSVMIYYLLFVLYVPIIFIALLLLHQWELKKLWVIATERWIDVWQAMIVVIKNGALLWINQLAFALILSADIFYAGLLLSSDDVSTVTIINKLVGLGVGILSAGLLPYFGLYVHRLAQQETAWIQKELSKAFFIIISIGLIYTIGLLLLGKGFVAIWTGYRLDSTLLYALAGLQFTVLSFMVYVQLFFQGPRMNFQILPIVLMGCIVRLAFLWGTYESIGLYTIFISSIIANTLLILLMLNKLRSNIKNNNEVELML
jgi:O-antigen/teichoic acid export membrane protein